MTEKAISVTEAARNFADCVNRAHYQGVTFVLHKNGVPLARIGPAQEPSAGKKPGNALALAEALAKVNLSDEEFASWRHDIEEARKVLLPAVDKWQ